MLSDWFHWICCVFWLVRLFLWSLLCIWLVRWFYNALIVTDSTVYIMCYDCMIVFIMRFDMVYIATSKKQLLWSVYEMLSALMPVIANNIN